MLGARGRVGAGVRQAREQAIGLNFVGRWRAMYVALDGQHLNGQSQQRENDDQKARARSFMRPARRGRNIAPGASSCVAIGDHLAVNVP